MAVRRVAYQQSVVGSVHILWSVGERGRMRERERERERVRCMGTFATRLRHIGNDKRRIGYIDGTLVTSWAHWQRAYL